MLWRTITKPELIAGCQNEFDIYRSGEGIYQELTEACKVAEEGGLALAGSIPGVSLVVNTALEVLEQQSVTEKLPAEVNERQAKAVHCIDRVTKLMKSRGVLPSFETAFRLFYGGGSDKDESFKSQIYDYRRNAIAPFMDVNLVAGGAARALERTQVNDEPLADILSRSTALLLFAKIDQNNMRAARAFLGVPYANLEHYVIGEDDKETVVDFQEATRKKLVSLQSMVSGCPSRRIVSPANPNQSLLQSEWAKIVHYMIPPHATISDGQPTLVRQ
jgi:hypothetical protein